MKPYGIPRHRWLQWPDISDIQKYACKSSVGKIKTKSGIYKNYIRSSSKRKSIRRIWKKRERLLNKVRCNDYLERE